MQYETYYGQSSPETLLKGEFDVVFVAAFTKACALAYALAWLYRSRGTLTVIGGPHARAFPLDAARHYEIVVVDCDEQVVCDIVRGQYAPGSIVEKAANRTLLPPLAERADDLRRASHYGGRPFATTIISVLASTGCPFDCNFCADWNTPYAAMNPDDLLEDLQFASEKFPGNLVAFHDPNFGVRFDQTLSALERLDPDRRNPYFVESSLSILKPHRVERLRNTNCVYVAPGVEAWRAFGAKAGAKQLVGRAKLEHVSAQFAMLGESIGGLQANFLLGVDTDDLDESHELTKEFIARMPSVFPVLNIPIAFGGTPWRTELAAKGRLLPLPPLFYTSPFLSHLPNNSSSRELVLRYTDLMTFAGSVRNWSRRLREPRSAKIKLLYSLLTFKLRSFLPELRRFVTAFDNDPQFSLFHEGRDDKIPAFYASRLDEQLGKFASLLPRSEWQGVGERPAASTKQCQARNDSFNAHAPAMSQAGTEGAVQPVVSAASNLRSD